MADKMTVIGERTKVSGNLEGDEDLQVKGRVEGSIKLSKTLHVEAGGILVADVDVKDCMISGIVVGDVTASDSVHITNGGRMVGDIRAPRVIIVAGAAFRGRVDMGDMDAEDAKPRARAEKPRIEKPVESHKPAMIVRPNLPPRPAAQPAAVAPRVATAAAAAGGGGKQPAPPAPQLPGGKKAIKKK
jgi:cytoskeletal protein CcmA (bactofilin family)